MTRRLPVILDIDAPDIERPGPAEPPFNTDGIENQHFVRLRPRDCESTPRPCRYRSCRYHNGDGSPQTCAIDVADSGAKSLREVGRIMGISNVAVLDTERRALAKLLKLRADAERDALALGGD